MKEAHENAHKIRASVTLLICQYVRPVGKKKQQNRTLYLYTEFLQLQRIVFRESRVKN